MNYAENERVDEEEDYMENDKRTDLEIEKEIDEGFINSPDAIWLRNASRVASQVSCLGI